MKTATVADLRNHFSTVSRWINSGEEVKITKRGLLFATLTPARLSKSAPAWPERSAWRGRHFPAGPVKEGMQDVIDYDRGDT